MVKGVWQKKHGIIIPRKIKGYRRTKKQKYIDKTMTLHHLKAKRDGGRTTVENGAILCRGCHTALEELSDTNREKVNQALRDYKKAVNIAVIQGTDVKAQTLEFDFSDCIEIPLEDDKKYNRAREKREWIKHAEAILSSR